MALAGALLGFLVWNRPPARIYLSDAGEYLAGTALSRSCWSLGLHCTPTVSPTAGALLFLAVPVADTTVAIIRRQRTSRPHSG